MMFNNICIAFYSKIGMNRYPKLSIFVVLGEGGKNAEFMISHFIFSIQGLAGWVTANYLTGVIHPDSHQLQQHFPRAGIVVIFNFLPSKKCGKRTCDVIIDIAFS